MIPYKQKLSHGCLAASLLILASERGLKIKDKDEETIVLNGMNRKYMFYIVGLPEEFIKKTKLKLNLFVYNKYFTNVLKKKFSNKKIKVMHHKINLELIEELLLKSPIIIHMDNNTLGDYSHSSHFIVLTKSLKEYFMIIDPLKGKLSKISKEKIINSIKLLKEHIKMCPLIFQLGDSR